VALEDETDTRKKKSFASTLGATLEDIEAKILKSPQCSGFK
jgi:hypothetical protein